MVDRWLAGFDIVEGNDSGSWAPDNEDAPKIVAHTTEGPSLAGALAAYRANNSWPHMTVSPVTRSRTQHVPLDRPARALRNTSAPGQTNREARVYQIEILGYAGQSHLWTGEQLDWLGTHVFGPLARATGTPLQTSVTFYGEGCGWILASENARQRLTAAEFDKYTGVLGHQHVPENTHWDPGALDVHRILAAARGITPTHPQETDDMNKAQEDMLREAAADAKFAAITVKAVADLLVGAGYDPKNPAKANPAKGSLLARLLNSAYRNDRHNEAEARKAATAAAVASVRAAVAERTAADNGRK